ncbi:MAG: competence protein CoiA family protein [Caldisericaceae bacterium]
MNKKEILFPVALNSKGELCYAREAPKGEKYYCTECKNEMILRRSETGIKRPHFAHKKLSPECYPETVLHNTYKKLLFERLMNAIKDNRPLYMEWGCNICKGEHKVNLVENIDSVELESYLGDYKPDIVLLKQGKPISVIEIIVTHELQENAEKYYTSEKISIIKIFLESDEEIYKIKGDILKPTLVEYCTKLPRCQNCGNYMEPKYLNITTAECWKCGFPYKAAWITTGNDVGIAYGPEGFSEREIKIAAEKGVIIEERYSKTMDEKYNANICPHCGSFMGKFFIHELVYTEDEKLLVGYRCFSCGSEKEE